MFRPSAAELKGWSLTYALSHGQHFARPAMSITPVSLILFGLVIALFSSSPPNCFFLIIYNINSEFRGERGDSCCVSGPTTAAVAAPMRFYTRVNNFNCSPTYSHPGLWDIVVV